MKTTPSTMSPLEAYEALMLFARRRGEGALRLAMHAAVPQSFRPDLLHLLKLNFLPRELHDPATEADVLFSPLCEETGRGYFEFGPHVRTLLLDNLAANYAADRTPRIARVANFLLFYVEHAERRAAGGLDRLRRDYLEVQRWVALAFLDPDGAARQLAAALKGTAAPGGEFVARLRLGGLASALSSPLVKYRHVLNYAAGLQALEAGDHQRARDLLAGLGDEEIEVGGIRLRPASDLLRDYSVRSPEPAPPTPGNVSEPAAPPAEPTQANVFLGYAREDAERVAEVYRWLRERGHEVWADFASAQPGDEWRDDMRLAMEAAGAFVFFLSRGSSTQEGGILQTQIGYAQVLIAGKDSIPALLEPCEIPRSLSGYQSVDLSAEGGLEELERRVRRALEQRRSEEAGAAERASKILTMNGLAWTDDPHAMETLTETVWDEPDSSVRLAAVNSLVTSMHRDREALLNDLRNLRRSRLEAALEALLVAAGDEDAEVRRAAANALAGAEVNAVLIYGFFGTDHVEHREVLREELRRRDYVPLVFPFTRPPRRNTAAIIRAAAPLTRFAVADLTAPPDIEAELAATLEQLLSQTRVPLIPISVMGSQSTFGMKLHLQNRFQVFRAHGYRDANELRETFDMVITRPAAAMLREMSERGEPVEDPPSEVKSGAPPPSFEYDIFISYAHLSNQPLAEGEQGWVDTLHERLSIRVEQMTDEPVKIWRNRDFQYNEASADSDAYLLSQMALFVAVVTPEYVRSELCLRELRTFINTAATQGIVLRGGRSRVFRLDKIPVEVEQEPEGLRNLISYRFFESIETPRRPRESRQEVRSDRDARRWGELDELALGDLAFDIKEALADLKRQAGRGGPSEAA